MARVWSSWLWWWSSSLGRAFSSVWSKVEVGQDGHDTITEMVTSRHDFALSSRGNFAVGDALWRVIDMSKIHPQAPIQKGDGEAFLHGIYLLHQIDPGSMPINQRSPKNPLKALATCWSFTPCACICALGCCNIMPINSLPTLPGIAVSGVALTEAYGD